MRLAICCDDQPMRDLLDHRLAHMGKNGLAQLGSVPMCHLIDYKIVAAQIRRLGYSKALRLSSRKNVERCRPSPQQNSAPIDCPTNSYAPLQKRRAPDTTCRVRRVRDPGAVRPGVLPHSSRKNIRLRLDPPIGTRFASFGSKKQPPTGSSWS